MDDDFDEDEIEFDGLPGIDDYLGNDGNIYPVDVSELDYISEAIIANCNITKEQSIRIMKLFFQEIRSLMLSGEIIHIQNFGKFYINCPLVTGTVNKIFARFRPVHSLVHKINHD